ncbi:BLUF domain-containing protein [Chloroflexia bacterium SDU3-3]|nr:BLUF domain-containing protein [Chloroflexia bacterium SDU3-3]
MIRIIYVSSAARPFSQPELEALLDSSRRNNQARGITGLLLYRAGSFMQILEGEERTVRAVYATICRDPRHTHIVQLDDSPIDQRSFGA